VHTSRLPRILAGVAFLCGAGAWIWFLQEGLVLSHYDAKAHLVVARRVIDSITPGWQQIGAVWLPLPHLIQILPTQVDAFYRTGAFASFVSIASFSVTTWAATRLVLAITDSALGAATAAALLIANPNLLYLQSTPMTEPLMLGVVFVVLLWMYQWVDGVSADTGTSSDQAPPIPTRLGVAMFAAAWTRYEAWLILGAALAAVAFALLRRGVAMNRVAGTLARLAAWPAGAAVLFAANSRITTGQWLVTGGFYELDPTYRGLALKSLIAVWWGTHRLSGYVVESVALIAAGWLTARALARRSTVGDLLPLALFSSAALPFYGFFEGHPFRVRYMVVMTAACALVCGLAVGLIRRQFAGALVAGVLVAAAVIESPPWSLRAAMIEEARWDVPRTIERRAVTDCLRGQYHHEKILASMGSLAHYMQELSHEGFLIADFIHEGNGAIWNLALTTGPAAHAGWMLVEEQSEGGDVLARRVHEDVAFTRGMDRICAGGGVALYRRR
jgi:hypothetical protein